MADLTHLKAKTENNGITAQGRLSANEWNALVNAVEAGLNDIEALQQQHRTLESEAQWDAIEQAQSYTEGTIYLIPE